MRVLPVLNRYKLNKNRVNQTTQFERKTNSVDAIRGKHKYTGVASVDLAYASMFDAAIAKDLKLMGLI